MVLTRRQSNIQANGSGDSSRSASPPGSPNGKLQNGNKHKNGNGNVSPGKNGSLSKVVKTHELDHYEGGLAWRFMHYTLVPILLMVGTPTFNVLLWYTVERCDGSVSTLIEQLTQDGVLNGIMSIFGQVEWSSPLAASIILGYMLWALVLMVGLPGPTTYGPITPNGNVPKYKDNGFYCFVVTMLAFVALTYGLYQYNLTPTIVYDHFGQILGTLTLYSHLLCIYLYFKGLYFPSTSDHGSNGNPLFDYFWGTELYPRILGVDIKVFTNCRFGMTVWPLLVLIFSLKSYELHGFVDSIWVSAALQMIYFTKFFWWESGYMGTIDIMMDRAGFCICWGCLAFIPGMYASVSYFLVRHPVVLGPGLSLLIFTLGVASIIVNYLADKQKQDVRKTNGATKIWGRKPEVIRAKYQINNGSVHESLLLVSGYWGVARHFHYIPELALAFCWSVPALFTHILPYFYFLFLCILLSHRSIRDEDKCAKKYGTYYNEYKKKVPYRMVPYIF